MIWLPQGPPPETRSRLSPQWRCRHFWCLCRCHLDDFVGLRCSNARLLSEVPLSTIALPTKHQSEIYNAESVSKMLELKSPKIITKVALKEPQQLFRENKCFPNSPKKSPNFCASFVRWFFIKLPNLFTLNVMELLVCNLPFPPLSILMDPHFRIWHERLAT